MNCREQRKTNEIYSLVFVHDLIKVVKMNDIYKYEGKIILNRKMTKVLRGSVTDWLYEFAPTHFISIQLPTNQRSVNLEKSVNRLKDIMKTFEKSLSPRHWHRKHLIFICFAEKKPGSWHFHLFLKNDRYTEEKLMSRIEYTAKKYKFSDTVIDIEPITYTPDRVFYYGNKELVADINGKFNSFRVILSTYLFNISSKHAQTIQKQAQNNENLKDLNL